MEVVTSEDRVDIFTGRTLWGALRFLALLIMFVLTVAGFGMIGGGAWLIATYSESISVAVVWIVPVLLGLSTLLAVTMTVFSEKIVATVMDAERVEAGRAVDLVRTAFGDPRRLPHVYVVPTEAHNAFATGIRTFLTPGAVGITRGLLRDFPDKEVVAILRHEAGHHAGLDIIITAFTTALLLPTRWVFQLAVNSITRPGLSSVRSRRTRTRRRDRKDSRDSDEDEMPGEVILGLVLIVVGIIVTIIAFIVNTLVTLWVSRLQEYRADAFAARHGSGRDLQMALRRLSRGNTAFLDATPGKTFAAAFCSAPAQAENGGRSKLETVMSTHPPIAKRVEMLETFTDGE